MLVFLLFTPVVQEEFFYPYMINSNITIIFSSLHPEASKAAAALLSSCVSYWHFYSLIFFSLFGLLFLSHAMLDFSVCKVCFCHDGLQSLFGWLQLTITLASNYVVWQDIAQQDRDVERQVTALSWTACRSQTCCILALFFTSFLHWQF